MSERYHLNYSTHPKYEDIRIPWITRLTANISFLGSVIFSWIFLIKGKQFPAKFNKREFDNLPELYKQFATDGVIGITDHDLSLKLMDLMESRINSQRDKLKPDGERRLGDCIEMVTVKNGEGLLQEIEKQVLANQEFKQIVNLYFRGGSPSLRVAIMHMNSEKDEIVFKHSPDDDLDADLNFFHVDTNLNTLKCMIYLNEVNKVENGAFEYVLSSHKDYGFFTFLIRRVIRKIKAFERNASSKEKLMSLLQIFRKKNELTDFSKDSELGHFVAENKKTYMNPTNCVVFDPLGIHRGGRVFEGERLALQLVFCCDDYSWRIL
jgi:hypothetical protein